MKLAAFALVLAATRIAHADDDSCGTEQLSDDALATLQHAADLENDDKADADVVYHVPVYLHIARTAPGADGDMPVAHARAITIDVLDQAFAAQHIPFVFELAKIDYLNANAGQYHLTQGSDDEKSLYDTMQVKGRRNLNIYLVGTRTDTSVTGWAQFMYDPATNRGDHVVLRYFPATGGFSDPLVPVHEVGHWLGLLHTFHFGCGQLLHGDLIRDTPTQLQTFTCAPHTDTCPDDPGEDATQNIMGYSHACRGEFSPGQITRMKFLYRTVRGGKSDDEVVPDDSVTGADDSGGCTAAGSTSPLLVFALVGLLVRRRRQ